MVVGCVDRGWAIASGASTRRPAVAGPPDCGTTPPATVAISRLVPHSPQNFWPGGFEAPHVGQPRARAIPHSPQNLWPAGFAAPQLPQIPPGSPGGVKSSVASSWRSVVEAKSGRNRDDRIDGIGEAVRDCDEL